MVMTRRARKCIRHKPRCGCNLEQPVSHTNSARPARPVANQSGFTLVELVVALTVGVLLLTAAVSFVSRTARILHRLRIEREIRDSGLLAVEAIEKGFRVPLSMVGKSWTYRIAAWLPVGLSTQ